MQCAFLTNTAWGLHNIHYAKWKVRALRPAPSVLLHSYWCYRIIRTIGVGKFLWDQASLALALSAPGQNRTLTNTWASPRHEAASA